MTLRVRIAAPVLAIHPLVSFTFGFASGFWCERDHYVDGSYTPTKSWDTYGLPWEWRTDGPRDWIVATEADGIPGYTFGGVNPVAFVVDVIVISAILLGITAVAWIMFRAMVQRRPLHG